MDLKAAIDHTASGIDIFRLKENLPRFVKASHIIIAQLSANHHPHKLCLIAFLCYNYADVTAVPHDADPVRNREYFRQLMGDINDSYVFLFQSPDHMEQQVHFIFRQRRGRLIHDHQLHVQGARLRNFNHLLFSNAQIANERRGIDIKTYHIEPLLRFLVHFLFVHHTGSHPLSSEKNIFRNRQIRNQCDFLMNKSNAKILRSGYVLNFNLLPVYSDLSLVRLVNTSKNVHQRRFARSVLAKKSEDLSFI